MCLSYYSKNIWNPTVGKNRNLFLDQLRLKLSNVNFCIYLSVLLFYFQKALVDFAQLDDDKDKTGWGTFLAGALGAVCLGALVLNKAWNPRAPNYLAFSKFGVHRALQEFEIACKISTITDSTSELNGGRRLNPGGRRLNRRTS